MFKKILVPLDIDYADTAALVYRKAAAIATLSGAEIKLASVMPGFSMPIVAAHFSDAARKETAEKFTAAVRELKVGRGEEAGVNIGPMISTDAISKVEELLKDAKNKGPYRINFGVYFHKGDDREI